MSRELKQLDAPPLRFPPYETFLDLLRTKIAAAEVAAPGVSAS